MAELTAKQKCFVDEYLVDGNGTRAAIAAGYSEQTAYAIACENLTKPEIAAAVAAGQAAKAERCQISADEIIKGIYDIAVACSKTAPIYDKKGNIIGQAPIDSANANRSWELLGKTKRLFVDRIEQETTNVNYDVTDPEQMEKLYNDYLARKALE